MNIILKKKYNSSPNLIIRSSFLFQLDDTFFQRLEIFVGREVIRFTGESKTQTSEHKVAAGVGKRENNVAAHISVHEVNGRGALFPI